MGSKKSNKWRACDICGYVTECRQSYRAHMIVQHEVGTIKYRCEECGLVSLDKAKHQSHLNSHTGEKTFICQEAGCGASFLSESGYHKHKVTKHRERAGKECELCGKIIMPANYVRHVRN